jgi:riboflavin transporter FmnP
MQNKGIMILLAVVFAVLSLYFYIFGFSYDKYWRWGQYMSLVVIFFYFMDELFKE